MKRLLLLFILLPALCRGQYTYFNNVYDTDIKNSAMLLFRVFTMPDSSYLALGSTNYNGQQGPTRRTINSAGVLTDEIQTPIGFSYGLAGSSTGMGIDRTFDSGYVFSLANDDQNGMGASVVARFNEEFGLQWAITLDEFNIPDSVEHFTHGLLELNDSTVLLLSTANYLYDIGSDEEPHAVRFTKIDSLGGIVNTATHYDGETMYAFDGAMELDDGNYFLWGHFYWNNDDYQNFFMKVTPEGEYLNVLPFGNEDDCTEASCTALEMLDGNILISYTRCIEQTAIDEYLRQFWLMIVDPITMVIEDEIYISIPEMEELTWFGGTVDICSHLDGGYAITGGYSLHIGEGQFEPHIFIVKVNGDFSIDWYHDYTPLESVSFWGISDIEPTLDGGFICSGSAYLDPGSYQRHWMLKIDACGDVVSNGCPPPIGIEEFAREVIHVFPNPTSNIFNIQSHHVFESVVLKDITGKIVLKEEVQTANTQLDISHLSQGIYMLEVDFGNGKVHAQKVVVE